jgi:transposase
MTVKQKKRRWPDDEKRSICLQTTAQGVSVAQVARRYAMNANLIFKWLRDDRYAPALNVVPEADGPVFLPVEIEAPANLDSAVTNLPSGRIEIELSSGHRITAEGAFDVDVLAQLLKGLSS